MVDAIVSNWTNSHHSRAHSLLLGRFILDLLESLCIPWPRAVRVAMPIQYQALAIISSRPSEYQVSSRAAWT